MASRRAGVGALGKAEMRHVPSRRAARRLAKLLARLALGSGVALGAGLTVGCGSGSRPPADASTEATAIPAPLAPVDVPRIASELLAGKYSGAEEKSRELALVRYQLVRARALFSHGHVADGQDAVMGALLLGSEGRLTPEALVDLDEPLLLAAHAAARAGDAGRAETLYRYARGAMLAKGKDDAHTRAQRADIDAHLGAIESWTARSRTASPLLASGEDVKLATSAALLAPSEATTSAAERAILVWLDRALAHASGQSSETAVGEMLERDLALEAFHAIRTGGPTLLAVAVRAGNPARALDALDAGDLGRAVPAGLRSRVTAASKNEPGAWLDLYRYFDGAARTQSSDTALPPYAADGARLWSAIQLHRAEPNDLESAMPLAALLVELRLEEVAVRILSDGVNQSTPDEALSWSVSLLATALVDLGRTDRIESARLAVAEAAPLLALAEKRGSKAVSPRPIAVYALLASLETRLGHAREALPLLERVAREAPTADGQRRLSALYRQLGDRAGAELALRRAIELAQKDGDVLSEALAEEQSALLAHESGDEALAKAALERAISRVLTARAMDLQKRPQPTIERTLARLSLRYGESRAARRAYERALASAPGNPEEVDHTLTEMSENALVFGDRALSRRSIEAAVELSASSESLVYISLWHRALERRLGGDSDGMWRQALDQAGSTSGWVDAVRRFGLGEFDADTLGRRARSIPERTEVSFYQALLGAAPEAERHAQLEQVAKSTALDLLEVGIARQMVSGPLHVELPKGIELPY